MDSENEFHAISQEEMKEFRTFHDRILLANTTDSNCQCTLIAEAYKYLKKDQIKYEEVEIVYDYKKDMRILVPEAVQTVDIL